MKHSALYAWVLSVALLIWMLWNSWILQSAEFFTQESLFYLTKAKIVFEGFFPKLPTMGLTFPLVPFQFVLLFYPIAGKMAPVVASSVGVTLLFRYLWHLCDREKMSPLFHISLALFFFLNPATIFLAVSGGSFYMVILMNVALLYHLLNYIDTSSTFNLAMAGIFYSFLIFVDFIFLWIFIFFLPVILLIISRNLEFNAYFEMQGFKALFRENTLRSYFIGKTVSSIFMFTILPAASLLLYLFFNNLFSDNLFDFLDNANYNFRVIEELAFGNVSAIQQDFFFLSSSYDFVVTLLVLSPFIGLMVIGGVKEPLKLYILLLPITIKFFEITRVNTPLVVSSGFLLVAVVSLFGIMILGHDLIPRRLKAILVAFMTLVSIWFNHKYFQIESSAEENHAYHAMMLRAPETVQRFFGSGNRDSSTVQSPFRIFYNLQYGEDENQISSTGSSVSPREFSQTITSDVSFFESNLPGSRIRFDFRYDPSLHGFNESAVIPFDFYRGSNPHMEAALFLRELSSEDAKILADDAVAYPVIALHGRIRDFMLPYENDFVTFISNPVRYTSFMLIPSTESFYLTFDMIYNVAPGLGTPDIPYRILFDNGVWRILESVDIERLARDTTPFNIPEFPDQEPFHSVLLTENDQSELARRYLRQLRSRYSDLQVLPVIAQADGNQWIRWRVVSGRFPDRQAAVQWRNSQIQNQNLPFTLHTEIDQRLFQPAATFDPSLQWWSLLLGWTTREADAKLLKELWRNFGITELRIDQIDGQYMLLTGFYNDFMAAELLAGYLTLQSHQRVIPFELPSDTELLLP